jgi:hypothetical protein
VADFVSRRRKDIGHPSLHNPTIKVTAAAMSNRKIACPSVNGNSVPNNVAVTTRPAWAHGFHVGITGFEVN